MTVRGMLIVAVTILQAALLVGGPAQALEIVDAKKGPDWYASEAIQKDKDGKDVKVVVFGRSALAFSPDDWNAILSAYGVSVVDAKELPGDWGKEVVAKDKDGKEVRSVTFNRSAFGMSPAFINSALAAYGLRVVDPKKLSQNFGVEVTSKDKDGKEVKQVVFSSAAYAAAPAEWNEVLSAYGR